MLKQTIEVWVSDDKSKLYTRQNQQTTKQNITFHAGLSCARNTSKRCGNWWNTTYYYLKSSTVWISNWLKRLPLVSRSVTDVQKRLSTTHESQQQCMFNNNFNKDWFDWLYLILILNMKQTMTFHAGLPRAAAGATGNTSKRCGNWWNTTYYYLKSSKVWISNWLKHLPLVSAVSKMYKKDYQQLTKADNSV
jgi:hypothetical protein